MLHIKDGINVAGQPQPDQQPLRLAAPDAAPARSTSGRSSRPPRTASSTTTTSMTAARSPTPTSASPTSRASTPPSSAPSWPSRRASRRSPPAPPRPSTPSRSRSRTRGDAPLKITALGHPGQRPRRRFPERLRDRQPELHRPTLAPGSAQRHPAGRRAAPAPSTSASSRRARTTARSPACRSPRTPTTRPSRSCCRPRAPTTPLGGVGGDVPSALSLNIARRRQLRLASCRPRPARYDTAMAATVISTAGNATLSVTDPSTHRSGPPGQRRVLAAVSRSRSAATNAANPNTAYAALSATAGTPVDAAALHRPDRGCRQRHARLPPGDRRHRRPARGQLHQDADVHAVHHHAVVI